MKASVSGTTSTSEGGSANRVRPRKPNPTATSMSLTGMTRMPDDRPMGMTGVILRAEAIVLFVAGVLLYLQLNGHPLWLLPLLLAPDLSMIGYVRGARLGAAIYNLAHNLATALVVLAIGWFGAIAPLAIAGAILVAHVGMDRSLGYGLKLPTDFRDTHLGRIGR